MTSGRDPPVISRLQRWVAWLAEPRSLPIATISLQLATDLFFNAAVVPAYLDMLAAQTEVGVGTTFTVRPPIAPSERVLARAN